MTAIASSDMQTDSALPAGWKWARLGEVCDLYQPKTIKVKELVIDGPYPVFGANGIIGKHDQYNHEYPEVIVTCRGATCGTVNMSHPKSWITGNAMVTKPSKDAISKKFLYMLLKASDLSFAISGSAQPQITRQSLARLPIPLPPLSEQERIARVLDECLASIARAKDAAELQLEAAVALPGAYLRQALPAEGDDLPAGWRWARLGEVCERISNINPKKCPDDTFLYVDISAIDRELKVITEPKKLLGKNAPSRARKQIRRNDVIVSTTRPNLNAVALVPEYLDGQVCSTGFCVLRPDESIDSRYLFNFTKTDAFVSSLSQGVNGAVYPAVTDSQVLDLPVPLPPLDEQRRIASDLDVRIAVAGMLVSRIREQLDTIDALPGAYLRKAFAGEI